MDRIPYVDVAGVFSADLRQTAVFILNRDLTKAREVELIWEDQAPDRVIESLTLTGSDLKAFNSFDAPQRVTPHTFEKPSVKGGRTRCEVPANSYSVVQWSV